MGRMNTCELREKEVINLCDGTRIGCPEDFEFDSCDGRITGIVVPRPSGFLGLCRDHDVLIPWCRIECIGEDAILVKLPPEEFRNLEKEPRKKRKSGW